jgi:hypothetical protein
MVIKNNESSTFKYTLRYKLKIIWIFLPSFAKLRWVLELLSGHCQSKGQLFK